RTTLISIMQANNEVGTLQPIREIAAIARERGILFHADAAQSLGKLAVDVHELGVDLLTVAGHKLYAPKGDGALFIRKGVTLAPFAYRRFCRRWACRLSSAAAPCGSASGDSPPTRKSSGPRTH